MYRNRIVFAFTIFLFHTPPLFLREINVAQNGTTNPALSKNNIIRAIFNFGNTTFYAYLIHLKLQDPKGPLTRDQVSISTGGDGLKKGPEDHATKSVGICLSQVIHRRRAPLRVLYGSTGGTIHKSTHYYPHRRPEKRLKSVGIYAGLCL